MCITPLLVRSITERGCIAPRRSTHITRAIGACTDRPGASNQHVIGGRFRLPSSSTHRRHAPVLISALNQMRDATPHDMQMNSGNQAAPRCLQCLQQHKKRAISCGRGTSQAIAQLHCTCVTPRTLARSWKLLHLTDNASGVISENTNQIQKL